MTSEYQVSVGWMNNQITLQSAANDSKNDTINKLHEEIARIKKEYNAVIQDIETRWRDERKEWQEAKE